MPRLHDQNENFLVLSYNGSVQKVERTLIAAERCATNLANGRPGESFFIAKTVARFQTQPVPAVRFELLPDDINAPVEEEPRVAVAPNDVLQALDFANMVRAQPPRAPDANARWIVEDNQVVRAPELIVDDVIREMGGEPDPRDDVEIDDDFDEEPVDLQPDEPDVQGDGNGRFVLRPR